MATKTTKTQSKKTIETDSKPSQLAKIMYEGIVRCVKAKNAQNGGRKRIFALDFERKRRVNTPSSH